MKKIFCDLCEKEIGGKQSAERLEYTNNQELNCDKKAKVFISIHSSFKEHSTGFGGPPDLCWHCFLEQVDTAVELARSMHRQYPDISDNITVSS